jgi:hypothetical protein
MAPGSLAEGGAEDWFTAERGRLATLNAHTSCEMATLRTSESTRCGGAHLESNPGTQEAEAGGLRV